MFIIVPNVLLIWPKYINFLLIGKFKHVSTFVKKKNNVVYGYNG